MRKKILAYILLWENRCYPDGIPLEICSRLEQLNKVPSYKQIIKAILKNDVSFKSLDMPQTKTIYYHNIKRDEIYLRNNHYQYKLFI